MFCRSKSWNPALFAFLDGGVVGPVAVFGAIGLVRGHGLAAEPERLRSRIALGPTAHAGFQILRPDPVGDARWRRLRWWRLGGLVRQRKWGNARDWFRGWICRWLGYLGLDHNASLIPQIGMNGGLPSWDRDYIAPGADIGSRYVCFQNRTFSRPALNVRS